MKWQGNKVALFVIALLFFFQARAQKADGYKGIWFTLGQFSQ
jgi:hypothetical protein